MSDAVKGMAPDTIMGHLRDLHTLLRYGCAPAPTRKQLRAIHEAVIYMQKAEIAHSAGESTAA